MFSVGYQPSRTNIKFFSSMPKKVEGSETVTDAESREDHSHNKLPPLTKLNQATSPWQRESSPWLQDSPLWQQSFSPWQNDRDQTKSYSRSGFYQQHRPDSKGPRTSRTKAVVSLGGVQTVESEKQGNFTASNSLPTCPNDSQGQSGQPPTHTRKLSISTPILDNLEMKPPSRGQLQGCRTAPGRNRDSNKTYLYCPQRQISEDLQTDFYLSSLELEVDQEDTLDAVVGIEDYKHFALRNPKRRTEIDLQRVYDRTYRPSLKLPKCNGAILTTINPQFINNNSSVNQQSPVQKKVSAATEHSRLSRNSSNSSTDLKSLSTLTSEDCQEGKKVRIITPAKCSPTKKQPSSHKNLSWLSYKLPCSSAWGFRKYRTFN